MLLDLREDAKRLYFDISKMDVRGLCPQFYYLFKSLVNIHYLNFGEQTTLNDELRIINNDELPKMFKNDKYYVVDILFTKAISFPIKQKRNKEKFQQKQYNNI